MILEREKTDRPKALVGTLAGSEWASSVVDNELPGGLGDPSYTGYCGSNFLEGLLATHYRGGLVVDPMEGGGTLRAVCRKHGIPYVGLDLRTDFDITKDDLRSRLPAPASLVFVHPPYYDMSAYSGPVLGGKRDERDLSAAPTYEAFLSRLHVALLNVYRALDPDGRYVTLVADRRRNGRYFPLTADVARIAPGTIHASIVKLQHNNLSDAITYGGPVVRVKHEVCSIYGP